jgi:molecular chaperone HtpG
MPKKTQRTKPRVGKFILDTISIGMYNDPLMVLREYIQNSTDAIDDLRRSDYWNGQTDKIDIFIDGVSRSLKIVDKGIGISSRKADSVLHNLGESIKKAHLYRGFRGIGRFGGLGYCEELKFITKFTGEKIYSTSKWDCKKLRELLNQADDALDITAVVDKILEFSQNKYTGSHKDHFFIVELNNIKCSQDALLDVPKIKAYLSQVAPVPFDSKKFSFAEEIEKTLRSRVQTYETYKIFVNGEQVLKPYRDEIRISQEHLDKIQKIEFKEFQNGTGILAFGWIAETKLLGAISPSELVDGIRLRSGNILIGNKNVLADFFRENRFNNYTLGEIHITDNRLILNSRRDDFEDNYQKEEFYNMFVKEIGLPLSQAIRKASETRSEIKKLCRIKELIKESEEISEVGYFSEAHYKNVLKGLKQVFDSFKNTFEEQKIHELIEKIIQAKHCLDNVANVNIRKQELKTIFDIIYKNCSNKVEGREIIKKTIEYLKK